ncbi:MAG: UDP-N-acetylmuramoylalanyl-D-glutamyl-2,6-diaminopimelate--D-alanyl-D-alanine ligase [Rhodospirillales bacterium]|jgi:UDP-N-acetylmuramoyl-tripeptide--D-alanyl-D-alanine ligase|nr:UDP-N-acetylmuramoylalanyl-D-glutamyl-2,6-diaminopimelate--D-alanyl-D-alanine ligase [Rhodospirillales bacterium]HJO71810.1 UDP-N-acetylmuramoylalanyl-D-glutamyl-2,6-diaminopimelate--D-alanyl-D-alanine ligase [Rhodospirillales bacterium]
MSGPKTSHEGQALWTGAEVAAAVGGRCTAPFDATGVSIDSRTSQPGDLFIALQGPSFDGHAFVADALSHNIAGAVVSHLPLGVAEDAPLVVVGDTLEALGELGRHARLRSRARVTGVTGSVGKTGTKEALKLALGDQGPTSANEGSLNNHWGLPLSLARMPEDTRFGVFEMGMNHAGEIEPLSRLARPHVALVTTVEAVHGAFFSSTDEIADAKAEIFAGMEGGGAAVLNRDNPYFGRLKTAARARDIKDILGFGVHADSVARLVELNIGPEFSDVVAEVAGHRVSYRIGIPGRHWAVNSLGVLAAVLAVGADVEMAAQALRALTPTNGRGRRHRVRIPGGAFRVIDESYNANPASMRAAIEVAGRTPPDPGGRRFAVLGDMLELGKESESYHADLAPVLENNGVDLVFTAGPHMAHLWGKLPPPMRGGHAASAEKLAPLVVSAVRPGDVVTVKGSAGSRTGQIVRALLALDTDDSGYNPQRVVNGK